jgi:hypothetical protein
VTLTGMRRYCSRVYAADLDAIFTGLSATFGADSIRTPFGG